MDGQALAGEHTGATANLEAVASFYVGDLVSVHFQPADHWLGLARCTETGPEILINPYLPAAMLGHIFFHEVAHLALGHVAVISTKTPAEMGAGESTAALLARLEPGDAATWRTIIDGEEAAANAWADDALGAFQRRFGPFLKAIGGANGDG